MTWVCVACGRSNIWWRSTCKDCGAEPGDLPLRVEAPGPQDLFEAIEEKELLETMAAPPGIPPVTYGVGWPD